MTALARAHVNYFLAMPTHCGGMTSVVMFGLDPDIFYALAAAAISSAVPSIPA